MNTPVHRRWRDPIRLSRQLPLLVWLVLLWMLLWDDLSWGNLLGGALLAFAVTRVFHLPPVELSGRFNLYWAAVFVAHFAFDLVHSSWQVAIRAFRPGFVPRNAVIGVRLRTSSDLLMTMTSQSLTLIPGSLIIEADHATKTLYLHIFDVSTDEEIENVRRNVLKTEERLIRALGRREECAALDVEQRGDA